MVDFKLVTYRSVEGPCAGAVLDNEVFNVAGLTGNSSYTTVLDVLNDWESAQEAIDRAVRKGEKSKIKRIPLEKVKLLAPVLYPSVIFCAGANYMDHKKEMISEKRAESTTDPHKSGLNPWHFIKASRSVIETQATIPLPSYSKKVDWEAELAVVIGRTTKNVSLSKALDSVAGYMIANDLSARDFSVRPNTPDSSAFKYDWVSQKSFDGSCPVGPWIVPAREIADPQNLGIKLWVNDVLKQDSHTSKMIFSVADQIEYLSSRITLYPGDLILTGTPAGVGMGRGEFLKAGDVVRVWVEGIGTLTNTME
jgi:2-keto-4-pentenoate hydratase/2-oxohepta-3-ene-1,7-dioic acid hydratase in catechol pathway